MDPNPSHPDASGSGFGLTVDQIAEEVLRRRERGEQVDDAEVINQYPHLAPDLSLRLAALSRARKALLIARRAGDQVEQIEPLSPDECDRPLDLDAEPDDAPATPDEALIIQGYAIQREISHGGQARVFKALQESTGRIVAVKVIAGGPFLHRSSRRRFEREVRVLASLNHPNIVGILDSGRTRDGSFFLVLDYIEGEPLDRYLSRRRQAGSFTRLNVIQLFARICDALGEAHSKGIIHRDLKPSNIRVDGRGEPHLLDFGLAHVLAPEFAASAAAPVTVTGNVVGSLPWASPEQASGELSKMGPASDVYSLAVVLYQAFLGDFPYPVTGTIRDITEHIRSTRPRSPASAQDPPFGPIEPAFTAVLLKALQKEPLKRYHSAKALGRDLERFLSGGTTGAGEIRGQRKHRAKAIAICLCAACVAVALWHSSQPDASRPALIVADLPRYVHDAGLEFVRLPLDKFTVGSPEEELGRQDHEAAYEASFSSAFWISTTEVTRGQYRRVMGALPASLTESGNDDLPVDNVTWEEAREFCRRLGVEDRRAYDLPTEAQWEYACRAGLPTPYSGTRNLDDMGWHAGNSDARLHPVGQKTTNQWRIRDSHGNVAEWCLDGWEHRKGNTPRTDPHFNPEVRLRIVKGGSVHKQPADCRSASRIAQHQTIPSPALGFRVVCLSTAAPTTATAFSSAISASSERPNPRIAD